MGHGTNQDYCLHFKLSFSGWKPFNLDRTYVLRIGGACSSVLMHEQFIQDFNVSAYMSTLLNTYTYLSCSLIYFITLPQMNASHSSGQWSSKVMSLCYQLTKP